MTGECTHDFLVNSGSICADFLFVLCIFMFGSPLIGSLGRLGHLVDHAPCSSVLQDLHVSGSVVVHLEVLWGPLHFPQLISSVQASVVWLNLLHLLQGFGSGAGAKLSLTGYCFSKYLNLLCINVWYYL